MFELFFDKLISYTDVIIDMDDKWLLKIINMSYTDLVLLINQISILNIDDDIKYFNFYMFILFLFTPGLTSLKLFIYNIYNTN